MECRQCLQRGDRRVRCQRDRIAAAELRGVRNRAPDADTHLLAHHLHLGWLERLELLSGGQRRVRAGPLEVLRSRCLDVVPREHLSVDR
jgi:hypothetical protein